MKRILLALGLGCLAGSAFAQSPVNTFVPPVIYGTTSTVTVNTTSGTLVAAGTFLRAMQVCTLPGSTGNVWINPNGGAAVANTYVPVWAGGNCTNFGTAALPMPPSSVAPTAITDGGSSQAVSVSGG